MLISTHCFFIDSQLLREMCGTSVSLWYFRLTAQLLITLNTQLEYVLTEISVSTAYVLMLPICFSHEMTTWLDWKVPELMNVIQCACHLVKLIIKDYFALTRWRTKFLSLYSRHIFKDFCQRYEFEVSLIHFEKLMYSRIKVYYNAGYKSIIMQDKSLL